MSAPFGTIPQLADYLVDGYWDAHRWATSSVSVNITGLTSGEQALAVAALNAWHEVCGLSFSFTSGAAQITYTSNGSNQAVTNSSWNGAGQMTSATINISGNWWPNTDIYSYMYQTYLHETGHALGLGHQGPYNGSAEYGVDNIFANDTWQWSIMSYFSQDEYGGSPDFVITPQMADIYAVQSIYGAATTTRTGNTTYGFNSNAGAIFDFTRYEGTPAFTLYDCGGADSLDCSGYAMSQVIDLRPGTWSSIGGYTNNIGIYLTTTIESAVGGSGNDFLLGNVAANTLRGGAGNDELNGGAAADILVGGLGRDTFVFDSGAYSDALRGTLDSVTDFSASEGDRLDLSGLLASAFGSGQSADSLVRALQHSSGAYATVQIDLDGTGLGSTWHTVAYLYGAREGTNVAVTLNSAAPGGSTITVMSAAAATSNFRPLDHADFGGDGHDDILWRHDDGRLALWQMNGPHLISATGVRELSPSWHIAGTGDFNGDDNSDILLRNDDGRVSIWQMDGAQLSWGGTVRELSLSWHISATGDFNGDGNSDILLRNDDGRVSIWQMNGPQLMWGGTVRDLSLSWNISGTGDFNGDGNSDILLRNGDDGRVSIWQMNGPQLMWGGTVRDLALDWHISGVEDFNDDGRSDLLLRNDNGNTSIWEMNGPDIVWGGSIGLVGVDWRIAGSELV